MRVQLLCTLFVAVSVATAQQQGKQPAPAKPLNLRGDRFPGLTYDQMTPAQRAITDRALAGRGPIGTFNIMLRSPELSEAMRGTGGGRGGSLSQKQSELAIITNARYWTTQFEWLVHHRAAVQAGLAEEKVTALIEGRVPALSPDEAPIYNFVREMMVAKQVSEPTFQAAKELVGEKGIVDLISVVGFYHVTSLLMNTDRYPMQTADQKPELRLIAKPLPSLSGDPTGLPVSTSGGRFRPIASQQMSPEQKALADRVTTGALEGGVNGPLNILLRSPEAGESILRYGSYIRFHSPVPKNLNALAAIITARYWSSPYVWSVERSAAASAGLAGPVIAAIAEGRRPASLSQDERTVYDFCVELLKTTQMSDPTFNAAKALLGERGVVELIGTMGYQGIASMLLNTDRYPMPNGAAPEIKALANPLP